MSFRLSRMLYVANLPWTIGQREFYEYFSRFGPVVYHNVVFDKSTGMSKKFGFLQFGNEDSYRELMKLQTHVVEGNQLTIRDHLPSGGQRDRYKEGVN